MNRRIVLLSGFTYMSDARSAWIADFLSLFAPAIRAAVDWTMIPLCADPDRDPPDLQPDDIVIGHEIPDHHSALLSRSAITFIDIRVSPARFCAHDNLLAIATNDREIATALSLYRVADHDLFVEARSLALSFRYRDLGQFAIRDRALIVFTEQMVDRDSIHFRSPVRIEEYRAEIARRMADHDATYYVHRGSDLDEDPAMLRDLGAERCTANLYAILGSDQVAAITAIRSGVLEEARYFGRTAHALGRITTPLLADGAAMAEGMFVNVLPGDALSPSFWRRLLDPDGTDAATIPASRFPHGNVIRRALNNWNSTATGLESRAQPWQELVHQPIADAVGTLRDELNYYLAFVHNVNNHDIGLITGQWRWFDNDIVTIQDNGIVRCRDDHGFLHMVDSCIAISWKARRITDRIIAIDAANASLEIRNQYGDGGTVHRVTHDAAPAG